MKLKMTKTEKGYENHILHVYEEGQEYEINDDLGKVFVDIGSAKEIAKAKEEKVIEKEYEKKVIEAPAKEKKEEKKEEIKEEVKEEIKEEPKIEEPKEEKPKKSKAKGE